MISKKKIIKSLNKNTVKKCVVTDNNDDGTYNIRLFGETTKIKNIPSISSVRNFVANDILLMGYAEGSPQKPFLLDFVYSGGGSGSETENINPIPTPPEPEMGQPPILYLAPSSPIITYTYTIRWDTQVLGVSSPRPPLWSWFEIVGGAYDIIISCNKSPLPPLYNPYYRIISDVYGTQTSNLLTQGHGLITFSVYSNQPDYLTDEWDGGSSNVSQSIQDFADQYIAESPFIWGGTTNINETPFNGFEDYLSESFNYWNNFR